MAIKKGIEPLDVLWKEEVTKEIRHFNRETREWEEVTRSYYYKYVLQTRRARTQGARIPKKLVPFFEALNIKIMKEGPFHQAPPEDRYYYYAVGVVKQSCYTEQLYNEAHLCERAQYFYDRMSNGTLKGLLQPPHSTGETLIMELRKLAEETHAEPEAVEDSTEEWPEPPPFQAQHQGIGRYY